MPSNMVIIAGKIVKKSPSVVLPTLVVMPCKPENSVKKGPKNSKAARLW